MARNDGDHTDPEEGAREVTSVDSTTQVSLIVENDRWAETDLCGGVR